VQLINPDVFETSGQLETIGSFDALIDTGASLCQVDEALLPYLPKSPRGGVETRGASEQRRFDQATYRIGFHFAEITQTWTGDAIANRFRADKKNWDIIVGMDFMQHWRVMISSKLRTVELSK